MNKIHFGHNHFPIKLPRGQIGIRKTGEIGLGRIRCIHRTGKNEVIKIAVI